MLAHFDLPYPFYAFLNLRATIRLWEHDKEPESNEKEWDELTIEEQRAASLLGFNRKKWDADSDTDGSSKQKLPYEDTDWSELPDSVRSAALTLGYSQSIWDNDGQSPLDSKDWSKLTKSQQDAAAVLGYDQQKWDDDDDDDETTRMTKKNQKTKAQFHLHMTM